MKSKVRVRVALAGDALFCLFITLAVLLGASARDVRHSPYYLTGYELLAALWLGGAMRLFPFFGVSTRDDVIERRNRGAYWTIKGAMFGVAACFAGANVGNGPGPEAVIFCAALASTGFFAVWFVLDWAGSHWADCITIDRDSGCGVRLGSLLLADGLAFGSAVTGDWISSGAAVRDFAVRIWPIIPILALAVAGERRLRRANVDRQGWLAATVYTTLTVACIAVERRMR